MKVVHFHLATNIDPHTLNNCRSEIDGQMKIRKMHFPLLHTPSILPSSSPKGPVKS